MVAVLFLDFRGGGGGVIVCEARVSQSGSKVRSSCGLVRCVGRLGVDVFMGATDAELLFRLGASGCWTWVSRASSFLSTVFDMNSHLFSVCWTDLSICCMSFMVLLGPFLVGAGGAWRITVGVGGRGSDGVASASTWNG